MRLNIVINLSFKLHLSGEGMFVDCYYYYYYYRMKRFRWRNVKRLQGHLTNAKDSDKTRVRRKVRTEYLSDAIVGRTVEIRKTSTERFRLQLTSKGRQ